MEKGLHRDNRTQMLSFLTYECITNNHKLFPVDDWRCDQFRWVNQGVTKLPRKGPKLKKLYFDTDTPNGPSKEFQRHGYQLLDDKSVTLIHYLGDEKAAIDFA